MLLLKHPRVTAMMLAVISGLTAALSFQSDRFWYLAWIAFVPFMIFFLGFDKAMIKRGYGVVCFTFAFFYHTPILGWMYQLKENLPMKGFWSVVAITAAIGIAVLQFALGLYLALYPLRFLKLHGAIDIISIAFLYIGLEWVQERLGFVTFPWIKIGLSITPNTPFIQSASLFGGLFISFLVLLVNGLIAYLLLSLYLKKKHSINFLKKRDGIVVVILGGILLINSAYGMRRCEKASMLETNRIEVVLVQGNHSGKDKWNITSKELLSDYIALTKEGITKDTKLVVWPETAIPVTLPTNAEYLSILQEFCSRYNIELVIGAFDQAISDDQSFHYNAMYLITKAGIQGSPYYKQKLVPFGEYLPYANLLSKIAPDLVTDLLEILSDTPGAKVVLQESSYGKIGGIICYESIYPKIARDSVKQGAEVFALISNDSWFGNTSALYQHHSQAIMRAVENHRYVLRASNTGITSIIDGNGKVVHQLTIEQPLVLREDIAVNHDLTMYTRIGDVIALPSGILWLYGIVLGVLYKTRKK